MPSEANPSRQKRAQPLSKLQRTQTTTAKGNLMQKVAYGPMVIQEQDNFLSYEERMR